MKIAALVLAHHRADVLQYLLARLDTPLWQVFLHLDARTDASQFAPLPVGVTSISPRLRLHWGHVSIVDATLCLMRAALLQPEITHFALLSGQCYPVQADSWYRGRLTEAGHGGNFIDQRVMPNAFHKLKRLTRAHFKAVQSPVLRALLRLFYSVSLFPPLPQARRLARAGNLRSGSQWWILSRDAVAAIVRFVDQDPAYRAAFQLASCPDEYFFHTAFHQLGLVADGAGATWADFGPGAKSPRALISADWDQVKDQGWWFARKCDGFLPPAPE